jgi:hypothetical protein
MEEKNDGVGKPSQEEEDILFTKGLKKRVETLTTKMGTDEGCRSRKIKWKINFPDFSASLLFFFFILLLFF